MRILVVTDAWFPQVNGVVTTLCALKERLEKRGHDVIFITPEQFLSVPCPSYKEIRLALWPRRRMAQIMDRFRPCAVHIATEGPLGLAIRRLCLRQKIPFTTAFHTRFPEYIQARFHIPLKWSYTLLRHFHKPATTVMVATQGIEDELVKWGFRNIRRWTRGVDTDQFRPRRKTLFQDRPRPVFLYTGRVAIEKNIEAFLSLDLPGSKVVVGDGPLLADFIQKYPQVYFAGTRHQDDLAEHFASADCFVFPSLTDTFGLVILEALACGLPVAAFPVPGPLDIIGDAPVGVLSHDLRHAALQALSIPPEQCRTFALSKSWDVSVDQFLSHISVFNPATPLYSAP